MSQLDATLAEYSARLDDWLREIIPSGPSSASGLHAMVTYHLGWQDQSGAPSSSATAQGKRIRPALTLLTCQALGGRLEQARGAAAGVELVHNFSLVHDDIQDHSATRRHRPTVWNRWGAEQAINVGDVIFTLAQLAITRLSNAPPETIVCGIEELNATCVRLVEGQYLDLALADASQCSEADYFAMIEGKTAALIACACRLGALFAGANATTRDAFGEFGRELGLAFQLQDDVLGVWGSEAVGKPLDSDLRERKKAIPAVRGLAHTGPAADQLRAMFTQPSPPTNDQIVHARALLTEMGIRAEVEELSARHYDRALQALDRTGASGPARALLEELCRSLLNREH